MSVPAVMPFRSTNLLLLAALGLITLYFYWRRASDTGIAPGLNLSIHAPANATLGFGAIYAVSGHKSPRRDSLLQAANVSELLIDLPVIPQWSDDEVDEFRDQDHLDKSTILDGSIKAWLSHAVVLREFLQSGKETALILEDDVDWDVRLRTRQIPSAAAAQRSLLPSAPRHHYWGNPDDWDILYLGHCGDYFESVDTMQVGVGILHPSDLESIPHRLYRDPTMPDPTDIHPFTSSLLNAFNIPPKTRVIHKSKWPLCTFGYAITRRVAGQLLHDLAAPKEVAGHWTHAYDIALLEACRDKGLLCYTVNPELFHHMEGTSLIDGEAKDLAARPPADRVGVKQVKYRNETSNIGCGFWSKDFYWGEDYARLAWLREEVGRKGRCLKPGRAHDGSRLSARGAKPASRAMRR